MCGINARVHGGALVRNIRPGEKSLESMRKRDPHMKKTESNPMVVAIEDLYELSQVAQMLRCSRKTVYRLISSGRLGAVRWGRSYRFRREDVQEFVRGSLINHGRAKVVSAQLTN
jgi:excisionase family DNA binding protein